MSGRAIILCTTLMLSSVFSQDSVQAQPFTQTAISTRTMRPNDIGLELLGKGLALTLAYQRMITPSVGLQVGAFGMGEPNTPDEQVVITLGGKFYFRPVNASPFATGGVTLLRGAETENIPYVGLGYEVRHDGGFTWRATLYTLFFGEEAVRRSSDDVIPVRRVFFWPGFYVGHAF